MGARAASDSQRGHGSAAMIDPGRGHAVIAHDDQRGARPQLARVDGREQAPELFVLLDELGRDVRMVGALCVCHVIGAVPPRQDQSWAFRFGQIEP